MRFAISRVIPIYRQFVRTGDTADVFHSLAARGGEVLCATRRHKILDLQKEKTPSAYQSRIILQKLDVASGKFIGEAEDIMPLGEDPRLIAVGEKAYVLTPNSPTEKLNYALFDVQAGKRLNLEFPAGCTLKYGKNWQPFAFEGELYAIHSFSPFRIVRIDTETGACEPVHEQNAGLDVIAPHDRFAHFRGGGTAMAVGEDVIGFAHFTIDSGRHMPFRWTYKPASGEVNVSCEIDARFLWAEGFQVIDPTSFFKFEGKYYLGMSCSNRDWFYGQTHASYLLELAVCKEEPGAGSLARALRQGPKEVGNAARVTEVAMPRQKVHFFRATEMQVANGKTGRNFEVHWCRGKDDAGFVIHGPYIDLAAGKYRARLQYASPGGTWQEIGYVDVCANPGGEQLSLAKKFFRGTQKELEFIEVDFEVAKPENGRLVETRVVSNGVEDIRLTDVAITRVGD